MLQCGFPHADELFSGCHAEQALHDAIKHRVNAHKENRKYRCHDKNHDRCLRRFFARRPYDLGGFGAHLTDEFTGASLCHYHASCFASFQRVAAIAPTGGVESDIGSDFGKTSVIAVIIAIRKYEEPLTLA